MVLHTYYFEKANKDTFWKDKRTSLNNRQKLPKHNIIEIIWFKSWQNNLESVKKLYYRNCDICINIKG